MTFYISIKFHDTILILEQFSRADTKYSLSDFNGEYLKKYRQVKLQFLLSARCLMMLYISVKFH